MPRNRIAMTVTMASMINVMTRATPRWEEPLIWRCGQGCVVERGERRQSEMDHPIGHSLKQIRIIRVGQCQPAKRQIVRPELADMRAGGETVKRSNSICR